MKKNLIIIIEFIILTVLVVCCFVFLQKKDKIIDKKEEKKEEQKVVEYKTYHMIYNDGTIPGNNFDIYVDEKLDLKIVHQPGCSTVECMNGEYYPEEKTYELNFSDENKKALKRLLDDLYINSTSNKLDLNNMDLTDKQINLINIITIGNEDMFGIYSVDYNYLIEYDDVDNTYYIYYLEDSVFINKVEYDGNFEIINIERIDLEKEDKYITLKDDIFNGKEEKEIYITKDKLSVDNFNIIKDMISKCNVIKSRELLYTLTSSGRVNCLTGTLKLYDDYIYEFIYGYKYDGEELIKKGKYTYDINNIINNIEQNNPNQRQPFNLSDSTGKTYDVYDDNKELIELVSEINVQLDTCLVYSE